LKASLERAIRENWTPAEISYVACAAIKAHNELSEDRGMALPERAEHLQWCVETYDACGPMDLDRGFMANLTRRASILFRDLYMGRWGTQWAYRAAEMDRRALDFGSHEVEEFASLAGSVQRNNPHRLHVVLSQAEIAMIEKGRLPWPSLGCWTIEHSNELAAAVRGIDRFLLHWNSSELHETSAGLFLVLHEAVEALGTRNGYYFSPVLHDRLARELEAIKSSHANEQLRAFASTAIDFYFSRSSLDVPLAVFNDCVASGIWNSRRSLVLEDMFSWANDAGIPEAYETSKRVMDEFDMHLLDRGKDVLFRTDAEQETLVNRLQFERGEQAYEGLSVPLPPNIGLIVGSLIGSPDLAQVRAEHAAEDQQGADNNRSINDFVATIARASASDYSNGNLLRLYGRLFHLRDTHSDPTTTRFLQSQLGVQIGSARDTHPDAQLRLLLDETLALFSPEHAGKSHDLPTLLLRAADGFIETASLQSERTERGHEHFHESWKVLLDRVNSCDFDGKVQLRASLRDKLMVFARQHPEQASWVLEALNWFEHDERYPVRTELRQLEQSAKQA
jgi:hypothetical protein